MNDPLYGVVPELGFRALGFYALGFQMLSRERMHERASNDELARLQIQVSGLGGFGSVTTDSRSSSLHKTSRLSSLPPSNSIVPGFDPERLTDAEQQILRYDAVMARFAEGVAAAKRHGKSRPSTSRFFAVPTTASSNACVWPCVRATDARHII